MAVLAMMDLSCQGKGMGPNHLRTDASLPIVTSPTDAASQQGEIPEASGAALPFEIPIPPKHPFVSHPEYFDCVHPGVEADCAGGWCPIPAGCFIWGSPEWEPHRGAGNEEQAPVHLTHDIEIMQYEVTVAEWEALGFEAVYYPYDACREPDCPTDHVPWFLAAEYANELSKRHNPPLEPCYVLEGCRTIAGSYFCDSLEMTAETAYECEGYRLPTRAERQYAARAGTITSYYSGDITVTEHEHDIAMGCLDLVDPNLEPIAWYCANSGNGEDLESRTAYPVGLKLPNAWGLYDMLGNVFEWAHDPHNQASPQTDVVDPFGEIGWVEDSRAIMGGSAIGWPSLLRVALGLSGGSYARSAGFRLVRTLGPGTPPTLADVPASNPQAR